MERVLTNGGYCGIDGKRWEIVVNILKVSSYEDSFCGRKW